MPAADTALNLWKSNCTSYGRPEAETTPAGPEPDQLLNESPVLARNTPPPPAFVHVPPSSWSAPPLGVPQTDPARPEGSVLEVCDWIEVPADPANVSSK